MRTASTAFKNLITSNVRTFVNTVVITLETEEVLTLTNERISFEGFEIEDSVGDDETFSALGATIINSCTLNIYNGDDAYSTYDFDGAECVVYTGLLIGTTVESIKLGVFNVEESTYTENTIILSMYDNMEKFDQPYSMTLPNSDKLAYPATLAEIVADACAKCGVAFDSTDSDFTYSTFSVATRPDDEAITFRDVIGWVATINGTFAKCNSEGKLVFKWFDLTERNVQLADIVAVDENSNEHTPIQLVTVDGTTVNLIDDAHYVPGVDNNLPKVDSLYSQNVAITDITITGIAITVSGEDSDTTVTQGTDDYCIVIDDNPLITADNVNTVKTQIATNVIGLTFRKCNVTCVSNPLLEAGDTAYLRDAKGNEHRILITRVTFSPVMPQTVVCGADTPNRKSATLYGVDTRTTTMIKSQVRSLRSRVSTVEQVATTTNQYFWNLESIPSGVDSRVSTGVHITQEPQEDFLAENFTSNPEAGGGNTLITSIGIAIRKGIKELATFTSSTIRLGLDTARHIVVDAINGILIKDGQDTLASFGTTTTIGKTGANDINVYIDSNGMHMRKGTTTYATIQNRPSDNFQYLELGDPNTFCIELLKMLTNADIRIIANGETMFDANAENMTLGDNTNGKGLNIVYGSSDNSGPRMYFSTNSVSKVFIGIEDVTGNGVVEAEIGDFDKFTFVNDSGTPSTLISGFETRTCLIKKIGNIVFCQIAVADAASLLTHIPANTTLFTLPSDYRPASTTYMPAFFGHDSYTSVGRIAISTTGAITHNQGSDVHSIYCSANWMLT